MKKYLISAILLFATCAATGLNAEVVDKQTNGFTIRHEIIVNATPRAAFREFGNIGNWWSSKHSWSGDAKNMNLRLRAGGCFCESLPNGGSVKHMEVVYVKPNEEIRMFGALGPLQMSGASGHLVVKFTAIGAQTKVEASFYVGGYVQGGLDKWANAVDGVLGEQFNLLKAKLD